MTKKALRNLKQKKGSVPYAHLNPDGGVLPQSTRTSRAMGIMILTFRSLALIVVQRHTAASKSASPCSTGQHVSLALLPIPMCTRPLSKSTHAPSFRVPMVHVPWAGGVGDGTRGGRGGGHGVSVGGGSGTTGGCGTIGVGGGNVGGFGTGVGGGLGTTGVGGGYTMGGLGIMGGVLVVVAFHGEGVWVGTLGGILEEGSRVQQKQQVKYPSSVEGLREEGQNASPSSTTTTLSAENGGEDVLVSPSVQEGSLLIETRSRDSDQSNNALVFYLVII
ncbi:hypothetical protein CJ030_MR7G022014 [Morella rubra]|uniref:Uncharacterized protein n=1 Tax=Morella rubra TaxID=262757 RepID=A0A6A1UZE1_9ROSI|nr:hypothetical protein CJ030_MR7G022014 [Morella rubra]